MRNKDESRFVSDEITDEQMNLDGEDLPNQENRFPNAMKFLDQVRHDIESNFPSRDTDRIDDVETFGHVPDENLPSRQQIGRFEILRSIGQGGYAVVFLARDPLLDRLVAIKVLKSSQAFSNDAAVRFEREAKAIALLNHPNIVTLFETGKHDSDRFIVSSWCDGQNLKDWFASQNKKIEIRQAAEIAATIADAVEHAHQRGIIHRDLKPANVLLEASDEIMPNDGTGKLPEKIRVADFGLAKHLEQTDSEHATMEDVVIGTPAYMAPEQAIGDAEVGTAADVYSIGVILYELLTGRLPIQGDSPVETLIALRTRYPHEPRRFNPKISVDLQAICLKCLEKTPDDRYASAFDLAEDLRNWMGGYRVAARQATSIERAAKWCKRNPSLTATLAGMIIGLIFAFFQWSNARYQFRVAMQQAERSEKNVLLAQQAINDVVKKLSRSSQVSGEFRNYLTQSVVELQEQLLQEEPNNQQVIWYTASSQYYMANFLVSQKDYEEAYTFIQRARTTAASLMPGDEPTLRITNILDREEANCLGHLGRYEEALQIFQILEKEPNSLVSLGATQSEKGLLLLRQNSPEAALVELEKGRLIFESLGDDLIARGELVTNLIYCSRAEYELGLYEDARKTALDGLEVVEDVALRIPYHESITAEYGRIQWRLGVCSQRLGEEVEARHRFGIAEETYTDLLSQDASNVRYLQLLLDTQQIYAELLCETGMLDESAKKLSELDDEFRKSGTEVKKYFAEIAGALNTRLELAKQFAANNEDQKADKQIAIAAEQIALLSLVAQQSQTEAEQARALQQRLESIKLSR